MVDCLFLMKPAMPFIHEDIKLEVIFMLKLYVINSIKTDL